METPPNQPPGEYSPPGRIGDPRMQLHSDPRLHPRLLEVLAKAGLDRTREPRSLAVLPARLSRVDLAVLMAEIEMGFESFYDQLPNDLLSDQMEMETEVENISIQGGGGQDMALHVYRPRLGDGPLPCVVYFHGGAMTILKTTNKVHDRWCRSLAAAGLLVVLVDFRNAYTAPAYHPYPAGLNDCVRAVNYIHTNRDVLNVRNIILQGDNGGANLALATALRAKRDGWIHKISGVYAVAPYISNGYNWSTSRKLSELPSLVECHGYFLSVSVMAYMGLFYTPSEEDATNPLAWPYHADLPDMEGLPPHVLVMDELDPLRDEGVAYARKLARAGVDVNGRVNLAVTHAANLIFREALPQVHKSVVSDVVAFAKRA